jgi:hypothetical protein
MHKRKVLIDHLQELSHSAKCRRTGQGQAIYSRFIGELEDCSSPISLKKTAASLYLSLSGFQRFADLTKEEHFTLMEIFSLTEEILCSASPT